MFILSPSEGSVITSSSIAVSWIGVDMGSGIDHYEIRLGYGSWVNVGKDTTYTFSGLGDGNHMVEVRAIDETDRSQTASINFIVNTSLIGGPGWIDDIAIFGGVTVAILGIVGYLRIRKRTLKTSTTKTVW